MKKPALALIAAIALLPLSACSDLEAKKNPKGPEPVNVQILLIEPQAISRNYIASGILQGSQEALVTASVAGEIIKLEAQEGDFVKQGSLMALIDPSDYRLALQKAEAVEEEKRKTLKRITGLYKSNAVSTAERDAAIANYKLAKTSLEVAKLNLKRTKIRSPIAGEVTVKEKILGDRVAPGTPLFKVVNTDRLKLSVALSAREMIHLKKSEPADIFIDSYPGKVFIGKITYIRISPASGVASFPVDIELENPGGLKPGMVARVKLKGETFNNLLLVPAEAVIERMGVSYLFVYEEGHAFMRPVQPGRRFGDLSEITDGLKAGDYIIPVYVSTLSDGAPVNVIKKEAESPLQG